MSLCVLSEDMLINQTCDNCHKYLSVKPVTLNCNNILCGRCEDKAKCESVPSIYNSFADNFLFKCINHFDGCDMLLTCDQVVDHEKVCQVHEYSCPGCPASAPKIPSYMFLYHMNKMHKKSCLATKKFTVELLNLKRNIFSYREANYLFFIQQQFLEDDTCMVLEISYIGDIRSKVFYKYKLKIGDYWFNSQKIECVHVNNVQRNAIVNKLGFCGNQDIAMFTVKFEFDSPMVLDKISFLDVATSRMVETSTNTDIDLRVFHDHHVYNISAALHEALLYSTKICKPDTCPYYRPLRQQSKTLSNELQLSTCGRRIIFNVNDDQLNLKSVCFHCILCKTVRSFEDTNILVLENEVYLICNFCFILVPTLKCKSISSLITKNMYDNILRQERYLGINKVVYDVLRNLNDDIHFLIIFKTCCIEKCNSAFNTFQDLKNHFKDAHQKTLHVSCDSLFKNIMTLSDENYILHWNIIICVTIKDIGNDYWISAEICDREYGRDYHVLCGLYSGEKKLIGTLFKLKKKIDLNIVKYITFITFQYN